MALLLTYDEKNICGRMDRNYWAKVCAWKSDPRILVHDIKLSPAPPDGLAQHACIVLDPFAVPLHPRVNDEDESRILEILSLTPLTPDDIEEVLERFSGPPPKSEPNIPAWVLARSKRDYARNLELRRTLDGFRVTIGMARSEVDAIFGEPVHTTSVRPDVTLSIYSRRVNLSVNPVLRFFPVAVVFHGDKAARVYSSRRFICRDWMQGDPLPGL